MQEGAKMVLTCGQIRWTDGGSAYRVAVALNELGHRQLGET